MAVEPSIFKSVKKLMNVGVSDTSFDAVLLMHINSAFAKLHQLGVGPEAGFQIEDDAAVWPTFLGTDMTLNNVKDFICLNVKLIFDPPPTSFAIDSFQKQLDELAWRINVNREKYIWVDPRPVDPDDCGGVIDGGES